MLNPIEQRHDIAAEMISAMPEAAFAEHPVARNMLVDAMSRAILSSRTFPFRRPAGIVADVQAKYLTIVHETDDPAGRAAHHFLAGEASANAAVKALTVAAVSCWNRYFKPDGAPEAALPAEPLTRALIAAQFALLVRHVVMPTMPTVCISPAGLLLAIDRSMSEGLRASWIYEPAKLGLNFSALLTALDNAGIAGGCFGDDRIRLVDLKAPLTALGVPSPTRCSGCDMVEEGTITRTVASHFGGALAQQEISVASIVLIRATAETSTARHHIHEMCRPRFNARLTVKVTAPAVAAMSPAPLGDANEAISPVARTLNLIRAGMSPSEAYTAQGAARRTATFEWRKASPENAATWDAAVTAGKLARDAKGAPDAS